MKTKEQIVKRLLESESITIDEAVVLLKETYKVTQFPLHGNPIEYPKNNIGDYPIYKMERKTYPIAYGVGGTIPYESISDSFKKSIDSIENNLKI